MIPIDLARTCSIIALIAKGFYGTSRPCCFFYWIINLLQPSLPSSGACDVADCYPPANQRKPSVVLFHGLVRAAFCVPFVLPVSLRFPTSPSYLFIFVVIIKSVGLVLWSFRLPTSVVPAQTCVTIYAIYATRVWWWDSSSLYVNAIAYNFGVRAPLFVFCFFFRSKKMFLLFLLRHLQSRKASVHLETSELSKCAHFLHRYFVWNARLCNNITLLDLWRFSDFALFVCYYLFSVVATSWVLCWWLEP